MRLRLLTLFVFLLALCAASPAGAQSSSCTHYAAPGGSDTADGTAGSPFRSVQRLVEELSAGDTGCLRGGTYDSGGEEFIARFKAAGSAGAPITLRSHPGERAKLVGILMVYAGADHVRIADLDIEGTGEMNTLKVYAADTVIENNDLTNKMRGESCIMLGSQSAGKARRTIIRRNSFHDCGALKNTNHDHSIYAAQVDDATIVDNTFSNSAAYSIQLYPNAQRTYVARNVLDGGPDTIRGGIVIGGDDNTASSGNLIENNVITNTVTQGVFSYWPSPVGTDNVVRKNCFWKTDDQVGGDGGLAVAGNLVADPGFVDRSSRDYRLADDSPCRSVQGEGIAGSDIVEGGISDNQLGKALEIGDAFSASSPSWTDGPVGCAGQSRATCRSRR